MQTSSLKEGALIWPVVLMKICTILLYDNPIIESFITNLRKKETSRVIMSEDWQGYAPMCPRTNSNPNPVSISCAVRILASHMIALV